MQYQKCRSYHWHGLQWWFWLDPNTMGWICSRGRFSEGTEGAVVLHNLGVARVEHVGFTIPIHISSAVQRS